MIVTIAKVSQLYLLNLALQVDILLLKMQIAIHDLVQVLLRVGPNMVQTFAQHETALCHF